MTTFNNQTLPRGWETRRLKTVLVETDRRNVNDGIPLLSLTREHGLIPQSEASTNSLIAQDLSNYKVCDPGDLVMNRMQAWSGMFAAASRNGLVSPDYTVFRPIKPHSVRYLEHLLKTPYMVDRFAQRSKGIGSGFNRLYTDDFGDCSAPIPPPDEQAAIVRYLNHADELISRYISAKEQLIALLEEQQDAAVQRAVTRGLNPNVPLEPSGTSWIGDIPAHWTVRRLRTLVDISTGGKDTVNAIDDGQFPFFVRSQTVERINTWSFDGEAVLTAGDGVGVGKVFHYINGKFDYHQRVYKFSQFDGISGRLFYHYLRAMLPFMTSQGTAKSTVDSLRLPMLQNFPVVVPPSREQESLIRELDQIDNRTKEAIQIAKTQIDLINEYRTRLIADVVTGQLDVRDAAVELPT